MIRLIRYNVAFRKPFAGAGFLLERRQGLLICWTEGGLSAWGEASPLPGFSTETLDETVSIAQNLASDLAALLAGIPLENPATESALPPHLPPSLEFAIDTLRADLHAKRGKLPFQEALRLKLGVGKPIPTEPAVGVNAVLGILPPDELLETGRKLLDDGFRTLKIKVGDPSAAMPVLRRLASDPRKPALRFDANGSWPENAALRWAELLAELNPEYLEQPFPLGREAEMARLQEQIPFPLAADESVRDLSSATKVVSQNAAQVLVVKPALIGSFRKLAELVGFAGRHQVKTVFTTLMDGGVARRAVAALAWALGTHDTDHGLSTGSLLGADPLPDGEQIHKGRYHFPDGPGIGQPVFGDGIEWEDISI